MEFFELGIGRISRLISDCFLMAAKGGLIFGIAFLLLSILLLVICRKYNLLKRDTRWLNVIARSYNFYLPVIFLVFGFALGATLASKEYFSFETKKSISPLMKLIFPAYQSNVNTHWARVVQTKMTFHETVDEYVDEIKLTPRNNEFYEQFTIFTANLMVPKITRWGIESVIESARELALKQSEEQGYIETNKVKALLIAHSLSMFNAPAGLWDETNLKLEEKAGYFISGIAKNILLVFVLLILFPVFEIIFSVTYLKRKSKSLQKKLKTEDVERSGLDSIPFETVEEIDTIKKKKRKVSPVNIEIPRLFEN